MTLVPNDAAIGPIQEPWLTTATRGTCRLLFLAVAMGIALHAGCKQEEPLASKKEENAAPARATISLCEAARTGNMQQLKAHLHYGCDVNAHGTEGDTPLHLAVRENHREVAELLLKSGANVNIKTIKRGWTPLHYAASRSWTPLIELLLVNGADINAKDKDNSTPIQIGCLRGQKDGVALLLAKGAVINARNRYNETPPRTAVIHGQKEVVAFFLDSGVNPNSPNESGETLLHLV